MGRKRWGELGAEGEKGIRGKDSKTTNCQVPKARQTSVQILRRRYFIQTKAKVKCGE
jgi:hypothetical protein